MAKPTDDGSQNMPDHIEQIRDIIFGPQKRQYDQRFERVAADLQKFLHDARTHADERCEALQKRFEATLASVTADFASKLQKMNEANTSLQRELAESKTKLLSDIRSLKEQVSLELEAHVSALRESKVSRENMAELLQELAMKLKGVEVLEELKKAVRKKPGE